MKTSKPTIWHHFIKALPLTLLVALVTAAGVLAATGTLDSPADPDSTNSYSLEDIYQRLVNGTAGSQSSFTEPAVAPGTGTMHTINDIMAAAPELDEEDGAMPSDVLSGSTFWGLTGGEWGLQTGSMASGSDVIGEDGSLTFDIPDACYSGNSATALDSDLNPLNIAYGVNIFGVTGRYQNGWSVFDQMDSDHFLLSVDMVSATDGWAVGGPDGFNTYIYHYDGFNWTEHSVISYLGRAEAIQMVSSDAGWIVTDGGAFLKYDSETDSWNYHSYIEGVIFTGFQMVTATEGWAITGQGKVYRYIEHTDSWIMHTDLGVYLADIDMVSTIDGWILSMYAEKIYRYDGVVDTWSEFQDVHINGNAIDMVSATDGWLVGNSGKVFRFDGDEEKWIAYPDIAGDPNLMSIVMLDANNGWIGTGDGKIYHYSSGGTWNLYDDGFPGSFLSFGVVNEGDIWAVGNSGYIYHFID